MQTRHRGRTLSVIRCVVAPSNCPTLLDRCDSRRNMDTLVAKKPTNCPQRRYRQCPCHPYKNVMICLQICNSLHREEIEDQSLDYAIKVYCYHREVPSWCQNPTGTPKSSFIKLKKWATSFLFPVLFFCSIFRLLVCKTM